MRSGTARPGRERSAARSPAPALAALLGAGVLASAAAPPPPRAAPEWTVDKAASRISFRGAGPGGGFDGVFKRWDAQLAFDPADLPASRLSVSVEAASAVTGEPARDALLPAPAWLAAARFPRATFVSRSFAAAGPGRYLVSGELTVRGAARPLAVTVTAAPARDRVEMDGGFDLDRGAFGVGPPGADAAVQVSVRLAARRAR